ncbi:MAG: chemotaxis protein CheA [Acidobacteriia bacterium]|nr:chemotaxis protein CheA [Terriglobia bacterium]
MELDRNLIFQSFVVESAEGLAQMEHAILELESHPDDKELVQGIFRVVHTAKGNAGILELPNLHAFAHAFEDLLDEIRNHKIAVTPEVINVLFSALDVLREMTSADGAARDEMSPAAKKVIQNCAEIRAGGQGKGKKAKKVRGKESAEAEPEQEAEEEGAPEVQETAGEVKAEHHKNSLQTLRVDVSKLDRLLDLTGEIAIARGRIALLLEHPEKTTWDEIREAHRLADTLHTDLQETVLKSRMVPVGPLFRQYARMVRDISKANGKLARLQVEGEDVEVDTSVVEHLKDPLLHMIRNAIDHGLELPAERKRKGKPPVGTVTVRAAHEGGSIILEVSDDGEGLNRQNIIEVAQKSGLASEPEKMADQELFQLIFEAGFSTAKTVSDLSGRGVGMDVVKRNVQALRGNTLISSREGMGTTVHIRLPLTLAIIEGFGVGVGEETFVIPMDQVVECVELSAGENDQERNEGVIQLRNEPLPYLHLREHFAVKGARPARQNIVVVQHDAKRAGLSVDVLYGSTQTVIKPLPMLFKDVPGVSGSAILGNGRVALILDVGALLRNFQAEAEAARTE